MGDYTIYAATVKQVADLQESADYFKRQATALNQRNADLQAERDALLLADGLNRDAYRTLEAENARLRAALEEIRRYNPIHNDLDAYLLELADWGLGERDTRPNPEAFGIATT